MKEVIIPFTCNINTDRVLESAGFNLELPYKQLSKKNVEGSVYQQMEGEELIEEIFKKLASIEEILNIR